MFVGFVVFVGRFDHFFSTYGMAVNQILVKILSLGCDAVIFREDIPLSNLLNKVRLLRRTPHRFILNQIVTFTSVLRVSTCA